MNPELSPKLLEIMRRYDRLNQGYSGTLRRETGTDWEQVNRHYWRLRALYFGGDCFLSGFPGAVPHQKLWAYSRTSYSVTYDFTVPAEIRARYQEERQAINACRRKLRSREGQQRALPAYRWPKARRQ